MHFRAQVVTFKLYLVHIKYHFWNHDIQMQRISLKILKKELIFVKGTVVSKTLQVNKNSNLIPMHNITVNSVISLQY